VVPVLLWLALAASPALAARGPGGAVITTTINTAFGTGILVPGTGIILNNERDDFSLAPGVPNVYDLVGGEANRARTREAPQSSMAPTIVPAGTRPEFVVGGSGGPLTISAVAQDIAEVVAYGWSPTPYGHPGCTIRACQQCWWSSPDSIPPPGWHSSGPGTGSWSSPPLARPRPWVSGWTGRSRRPAMRGRTGVRRSSDGLDAFPPRA